MKRYWDININKKIAIFKDNEKIFKIKFSLSIDEDYLIIINKDKVLQNNLSDDDMIKKMARYMRFLGDELSFYYFQEKIEYLDTADSFFEKMYKIDEDFYVNEYKEIFILKNDIFYNTGFYTDDNLEINEDTPKNLIKLLISDWDNKSITFHELKEFLE